MYAPLQPKGCREAEWIISPWLAKMTYTRFKYYVDIVTLRHIFSSKPSPNTENNKQTFIFSMLNFSLLIKRYVLRDFKSSINCH